MILKEQEATEREETESLRMRQKKPFLPPHLSPSIMSRLVGSARLMMSPAKKEAPLDWEHKGHDIGGRKDVACVVCTTMVKD
jgi:hypothetical protein